jgi:hypothetical protein
MMTKITPTIRIMTPEEIRPSRLINAGSVIEYEGTTIPITAGGRDRIYVYKESTVLYVFNIDQRFEYIGMEILDAASGEQYDSIFIHNSRELYDYLGSLWEELPPETIVKKFREFFT